MVLSLGAAAAIGAGSSLMSGALGSASAYQQYQYQKKLMDRQADLNYKYGRATARNQYVWNRSGLEKANYNPLLAVQNGSSSVNSNFASGGSSSAPEFNSSLTDGLAFAQQKNNNDLTFAQVKNYNADTSLKNNQSVTETVKQLTEMAEKDKKEAETKLLNKNIEWYDKIQAREDIRLNNEILRTTNDFKIGLMNATANQITSQAQSYDIMSNATARVESAKRYNEWARKHPNLASFDETMSRWFGNVGSATLGYFAGRGKGSSKRVVRRVPTKNR